MNKRNLTIAAVIGALILGVSTSSSPKTSQPEVKSAVVAPIETVTSIPTPTEIRTITPTLIPIATNTPTPRYIAPTATPAPTVYVPPAQNTGAGRGNSYSGGDKDCGDFATHAEAQSFFIANGGPSSDPHRLDADNDGSACETLP